MPPTDHSRSDAVADARRRVVARGPDHRAVGPRISARALLGWSWALALTLVATSLVLRLVDPGLGTDDLTVDDPAAGTRAGEDRPAPPFDGFYRLRDLVAVDGEANLPTWFSVALLLGSALVLWQISVDAHRRGDRWWRHWAVLTLGVAYLSVDELAQLHEVAGDLVGLGGLGGALTFSWVVVAGPVVVVVGVLFARFLAALPPRVRAEVLVAGTVYVGGALGMEVVGGALYDATGSLQTRGYILASSVEELLEMVGAALLLHALLLHSRAAAEVEPSAEEPEPAATLA